MFHKAVILSAGRGSRLHPLTADRPKCLLEIAGATILDRQLDSLAEAGVTEAVVVTGFKDELVTAALARRGSAGPRVSTLHNPFYGVAENVTSAWMARGELLGGALLLNGDSLIGPDLVRCLIDGARSPVTLCSDIKGSYDADDMKLAIADDIVLAIGKTLPLADTGAESVGLTLLTPLGAEAFVAELEAIVREPEGLSQYYLHAIGRMARMGLVGHVPICGHDWCEVDYPGDVEIAEAMLSDAYRLCIA